MKGKPFVVSVEFRSSLLTVYQPIGSAYALESSASRCCLFSWVSRERYFCCFVFGVQPALNRRSKKRIAVSALLCIGGGGYVRTWNETSFFCLLFLFSFDCWFPSELIHSKSLVPYRNRWFLRRCTRNTSSLLLNLKLTWNQDTQ